MKNRKMQGILLVLMVVLTMGSICFQGRAELIGAGTEIDTEADSDIKSGMPEETDEWIRETEESIKESEESMGETEVEKPELNVKLVPEGDSPLNNSYYRSEVTIKAVVSGGDAAAEDMMWTIGFAEASGDEYAETVEEGKDCLVFAEEGSYKVQLCVTDAEEHQVVSEPVAFKIDCSAPEAWIVYQRQGGRPLIQAGDAMAGPVYFNETDDAAYACLVLSERNISEAGIHIHLSIQTDENHQKNADERAMQLMEKIQRLSEWQRSGQDTLIYRIPIEMDGHYQIAFDYTDLAGHALKKAVTGDAVRDTESPLVQFVWEEAENGAEDHHGRYYKGDRELNIVVMEQNFNFACLPEVVTDNGNDYDFLGWEIQGDAVTGTMIFSDEGDYSVAFECVDLAGNHSKRMESDEFTIDKTQPVIQVDYDNTDAEEEIYYQDARTASIMICERNFRPEDAIITAVAKDGETMPVISEWSDDGDYHSATVHFESDGIYSLTVKCADRAGNTAESYQSETFIIDKTEPMLLISGVKDQSANHGVVAPLILLYDRNDDGKGMTISLKDGSGTEIDLGDRMTSSSSVHGQMVQLDDFDENMDGFYTLTASASDRAGNRAVRQICFSVNRHGSSYILPQYVQNLVKKQYVNRSQNIMIDEVNVDDLVYQQVSYNHDGESVLLEQSRDYTVEETENDNHIRTYTYTIPAACFQEEGHYSIHLYSEDRASNVMTNQAKGAAIDFIVDDTAPKIVVSDLEDGGCYYERTHAFAVSMIDNTVTESLMYYVDDELVRSFDADELADVMAGADGVIQLTLEEKTDNQKVKFVSRDAAGNESEPVEMDVFVGSKQQAEPEQIKRTGAQHGSAGMFAAVLMTALAGIFAFGIMRKKHH